MSDTLVTERGATRWFRPDDYGGSTGAPNFDRRRVAPRDPGKYRRDYEDRRDKRRYPNGRPGEPGYKPRRPKPVPQAKPLPFRERVPVPFGRAVERGVADPTMRPGVLRALARLLGRANPYLRALEIATDLADTVRPNGLLPPTLIDSSWSLCTDCLKPPPFTVIWAMSTSRPVGSAPCWGHSTNCFDGQNGSGHFPIGFPVPANVNAFFIAHARTGSAGQIVYDNKRRYARPPGVYTAQPPLAITVANYDLAVGPMPNPNAQRLLASEPNLAPPPPPPSSPPPQAAAPYKGVSFGPGGGAVVKPGRRVPPGKREKHNKNTGPAALAVALFKGLEAISEMAEVVDALYDALPSDVRARWDRKGRGLVDQAGQYGIDGADWKLQALYYNWSKVDGAQAVKNLINNAVQDKVHGGLHKHLPRNTGSALDPGFAGVEKLLQSIYL